MSEIQNVDYVWNVSHEQNLHELFTQLVIGFMKQQHNNFGSGFKNIIRNIPASNWRSIFRMKFPEDFFAKMEPRIQEAFGTAICCVGVGSSQERQNGDSLFSTIRTRIGWKRSSLAFLNSAKPLPDQFEIRWNQGNSQRHVGSQSRLRTRRFAL